MKERQAKLEVRELRVWLGGAAILQDVSARFPQGTISAIIGPNGSGKSTFARAVCGMLDRRCVRGGILLDGMELFAMNGRERARRIAGFPQTRPIPDLTVTEMIRHGRYPYRNPGGGLTRKDHDAVLAAVEMTGLGGLLDRKLTALSGGERQRAYLAMMLAQDAGLLVLDEPTAYLDISAQLEFLDILKDRNRAGKTIIVILHDIPQAFGFADSVLVMDGGRIVCGGAPDDPAVTAAAESVFGIGIAQSRNVGLYGYGLFKK